jgi:hypothetical protein
MTAAENPYHVRFIVIAYLRGRLPLLRRLLPNRVALHPTAGPDRREDSDAMRGRRDRFVLDAPIAPRPVDPAIPLGDTR